MTARRLASRRLTLLLAAVLAAAVTAGLGGCGAAGRSGTAAVVDGRVVTTDDVVTATTQLNDSGALARPLGEREVLNWLVLAPFVERKVAQTGGWAPDNQYNSFVAQLSEPAPPTIALVRANNAAAALSEQAKQEILAEMATAQITINPRYGQLDPATGALGVSAPAWIATATAPAAGPARPAAEETTTPVAPTPTP